MPYKKQKPKPFEELTRLLKGYDLTPTALSKVLGCSIPTARTKLLNPGRMTLNDIAKIHTVGHIEWERIKDTLKG